MKNILKCIAIWLQILFTATPAAAFSLGSLLSSAATDISSGGVFAYVCAILAGIVLTIKGFLGMAKGSRGGDGIGLNILSVVIGVILISMPTMILAASGTFTNNGASAGLSKLGIGG